MLISLSHKFMFVANLKSASTSIERSLSPFAEFKATKTNFGKHDDLSTISKKFGWIKKYVRREELFVFGVMRDPVDYILSLYNFHTGPGFDGKRHSSKGMTFDQFLRDWCGRSWQAKPQHQRFVDRRGFFRMTHIIEFAQLENEFPQLCARFGVDASLPKVNISPMVLSRSDLNEEQIRRIETQYADDYAFMKSSPRAL
jgi:hypothetical protein